MNTRLRPLLALAVLAALGACAVGPDYVKPAIDMPTAYKENTNWKTAEPADALPRGKWWSIYADPGLDGLMSQVASANQNVLVALAQYRQAQAAAQAARAGFFPTVAGDVSVGRARSKGSIANSHALTLDASWEPDLWGSVSRSVEANDATVQSDAALLAAAQLSAEATLAQDYFQLRITDQTITLQTNTVAAYTRSLKITQDQFAAGIVTRADVAQAQTQLKNAEASLTDLGVTRAQLEHAIAILVGKAPAAFSLAPASFVARLPEVPVGMPSTLLERRPDVAAAERKAAAANAQIGVARAAYFPNLTLSAAGGFQNSNFSDWFSVPSRTWSLGAALAETLFDGGLRDAKSKQAVAAYDVTVAQYRQTVLGAMQEVEDNLAALRILADETVQQNDAVTAAREAERLALNQYKAGIVNYTSVVSTQAATNSSERAALQLLGRRYAASVLLVKALGGGWQGLEQQAAK